MHCRLRQSRGFRAAGQRFFSLPLLALALLLASAGVRVWSAPAVGPPPAPKPVLSESEREQGWILLFDGESFNGWKGVNTQDFPYNGWAVENGYIRTIAPGPSGDIITAREFRDFDLKFSWRIEKGGNSGVKYLVAEGRPEPNIPSVRLEKLPRLLLYLLGIVAAVILLLRRGRLTRWLAVRVLAIAVIVACGYAVIKGARAYVDQVTALRHSAVGLEYQVLDDFDSAESKSNPKASAASLYILRAASPRKELFHDDRFNEGRIVVRGNHVEHWLNGAKVLEYSLNDPALAEAVAATKYSMVPGFLSREGGHIALQHHHNLVWFKDIRICPLTPDRQ